MLDNINNSVPMLVTSESGHVAYVNSKGLQALKICQTITSTDCPMPIVNPAQEIALSQQAQLDEDLALYAVGQVIQMANQLRKPGDGQAVPRVPISLSSLDLVLFDVCGGSAA